MTRIETALSVVTLEIAPEGEGSVATLSHQMDAQWADYVGRTEDGWPRMLEAIGELVEGQRI